MAAARREPLEKVPGVAETLDWASTLVALHRDHLDDATVTATLGVLFKSQDDVTHVRRRTGEMLAAMAPVRLAACGGTRVASSAARRPAGVFRQSRARRSSGGDRSLSARIVGFCRHLRDSRHRPGPGRAG